MSARAPMTMRAPQSAAPARAAARAPPAATRRRTAEQRDELAPFHVGHRGLLQPWSNHQQRTDPCSRITARSACHRPAAKSLGQT